MIFICLIYRFQIGQTVRLFDCATVLTCKKNGVLEVVTDPCKSIEDCVVKNGVAQCQSREIGELARNQP